jgi:hypothetical protein
MDDQQTLIAAAKDVARQLGRNTITSLEFERLTGRDRATPRRRFGSWSAFCLAAGLVPSQRRRPPLSDEEIFAAMRDAFLALGGIGPKQDFDEHFRLRNRLLWERGWSYPVALYEFRLWVEKNDPQFPYLDQLPTERPPQDRRKHWNGMTPRRGKLPRFSRRAPRRAGAPVCGDLLGFRCFAHAPTNEIGVAMLFTLVAEEFGFLIESVQIAFPDCFAYRQIGHGRWQRLRIEFEFLSRNFVSHAHDPAGCDLIVCWEDNWGKDCPVPVFELKKMIARLEG